MRLFVEKSSPAAQYRNHAAAVVAAVADLRQSDDVSFDAIRAALGKSAKQLPDGWIHQALIDAGIPVQVGP